MQVILMEKVANLGNLGDVVKVKDGFARNFLIPQGKAKRATPENIKQFEGRRAELEKAQNEALAKAQERGREARRPDAADHAEGRRRRAALRLGDQLTTSSKRWRSRATRSSARRCACRRDRSSRSANTPIEVVLHTDVTVTITAVAVLGEQ